MYRYLSKNKQIKKVFRYTCSKKNGATIRIVETWPNTKSPHNRYRNKKGENKKKSNAGLRFRVKQHDDNSVHGVNKANFRIIPVGYPTYQ